MAITAEDFEPEHFEKLVRGVQVACEAYGQVRKELEDAEEQLEKAEEGADAKISELNDTISKLRDELSDAQAASFAWSSIVEFIEDVDRGVRTLPELLAYLKERT